MGTLYHNQTPPPHQKTAIQDLKVAIQHSTLIYPSQKTENKSIFLSNIDQVLNFHVQTLSIFTLSPNEIDHLKETAKAATKVTGFNVVAAHIRRCKALSSGGGGQNNSDRVTTVLYAVDIRGRLEPPLPASYCGNAVSSAYATAKCSYLEEEPFSRIVDMVFEGAERMSNDYARSAVDWGEVYKGFPNGEFLISSWWRLGFDEVVYPWGKPRYSCPVVYHRKDIVLLFPEIGGAGGNGVNILVALPAKEMEIFQSLFHKYLP